MSARCVAALLSASLATVAFPALAQSPARATSHGVIVSDIDPSVKPGDNFYLYANGKWQARTQIPADRSGVSIFSSLGDIADARVATIIADAARAPAAAGNSQRRISDLYRSYMNEPAIEAHGLAALQPKLKAIADVTTNLELSRALGATLRADVDALNNTNFHTPNLFGLWVAPGFNDPAHYAPYLLQGGLLLPSREYYLSLHPEAVALRKKYLAHAAAVFKLAGYDKPELRAARVLDLETQIAGKQVSLADSENIEHANNTWKLANFHHDAPGIAWEEFFRAAGLGDQTSFIVWQPSAVAGESAVVALADMAAWRDYLVLHLLEANSSALPRAFQQESFAFFGTVLSGATQQRPRSDRATATVNAVLGDAVGQLYVRRFFSAAEKAQVEALVKDLIATFRRRLETLAWMAPATRTEAIAKLDALRVSVGYPDHFRTYDGLEIRPDDLLGNLQRASLFEYHYSLSRLGKPVDHGEWVMTPQTVNAVNLPLHNALNFPAAILQPPFFDPAASPAANYGSIGSVIGHEISHTFDSEGAAFDAHGRLRNWWTPADLAHFNASTAALAQQYDGYRPFADLAVNGKQTLGENIADVAGLLDALEAFHASLKGSAAPVVDGFSGDQQFFIAYAQSRAAKLRETSLRRQILTDPHAPAEYRADAVRNIDAWYTAFPVKPGDKLYLDSKNRVSVY